MRDHFPYLTPASSPPRHRLQNHPQPTPACINFIKFTKATHITHMPPGGREKDEYHWETLGN